MSKKEDEERILLGDIRDDEGAMRKVIAMLAHKAQKARENPADFFTFVMREETTRRQLTLSPHQKVLFDFVIAHEKCVIMLPVGHSKCTTHDTKITDPETGLVHTIQEIVEGAPYSHVLTWSKDGGVHSAPITAKHDTGTKECIRITLRSGRHVDVTPEHPMLTPEGWKRTDELKIGGTIAGVTKIPHPRKPVRLPPGHVEFLSVMLAEGCTRNAAAFTTSDPAIVDLMRESAAALGTTLTTFKAKYQYGFAGLEWHKNPAMDLLKVHGLFGKLAKEKTLPDAIFRLPADQLATFLSIFWMCDGYVSMSNGPSLTLASETMLRQIQHLLLRFGIQSSVTYRQATLNGKKFDAWRLVVRSCSLKAFANSFQLWGEKKRRAELFAARKLNANLGFPKVSQAFIDEALTDLKASGVSMNSIKHGIGWNSHLNARDTLFSKRKRQVDLCSVLRTPFEAFYKSCNLEAKYGWLFDETIHWDEIVSLESVGEKRVFDLTVAPTACFIANDMVAHNTFCMGALAMWFLGHNPTTRGAIVSATQLQAMKPLSMVRDYIEQSAELKMVFPKLRRSPAQGHAWTQTAITVERPMGIKDHSLVALGLDGAIAGSRLNFVLVDDILNRENTATPEQRAKVYEFFDSSILSRLDPTGSRIIVTNTAWHSRDLVHDLKSIPPGPTGELRAWPTLKMSAMGEIRIYNTDFGTEGQPGADDLRDGFKVTSSSVETDDYHCRLTAHDPDPYEEKTLFPLRFPPEALNEIRNRHAPIEFSRAYLNEVRNDADAMCKDEYITKCKRMGVGMTMASEYKGLDTTFTGVDLAVSPKEGADYTAFFTFRVLPDGRRLILDVEYGRYAAPEIVRKVIEKGTRFNSVVCIENNAGQDYIRQFASAEANIAVKAYTTGKNKAHPDHGVPALFTEMSHGGWIIPCNERGETTPAVKRFIEECLEYTPSNHTGDILMACFFAREMAKKFGLAWGNGPDGGGGGGNIGASIMSR